MEVEQLCYLGTILLYTKSTAANAGHLSYIELWILQYRSCKLRTIIVYRTPYSAAHPVVTSVFFDEFFTYLEFGIMSSEPLLIVGDFNTHVDISHDNAIRFLDLLSSMGLDQHVDKPTHTSGHTLDLIITRNSDTLLPTRPLTDYLFSDHITVICDLTLGRIPPTEKQVSNRKIKVIDKTRL